MDKKVQAERYKCYGCYSLVFKKKEAYLRHLRQHLDIAVMPPVTSNDVELKRLKLKIDIQFNFPGNNLSELAGVATLETH